MGRSRQEGGIARRKRSPWRRALLGALLPLGLLAWEVDPGTLPPARRPAAAAPAAASGEAAVLPFDASFIPPPPSALAPRIPQHVARPSLELPRRHRRSFLTGAFAAAELTAEAPSVDASPPLAVAEEVWPLGLPDNPLTDLRPLYFVDGPGGGAFPLARPHTKVTPTPVPEPGTALLLALGLVASGLAARRMR